MTLLTGKLLVAPAAMSDPNFANAVTLVLAHNADGAFGLVLDRQVEADVTLDGDWPGLFDGTLWSGGPCEIDRLVPLVRPVAKRHPENFHEFTSLLGGLGVVDLRLGADPGDYAAFRLFVGYAGWGPGQLDGEVAMGGWIVADAEFDDPFAIDWEAMRGRVLRRVHGRASTQVNPSTFPDDISAN
jgi:putative transcriptional regulator